MAGSLESLGVEELYDTLSNDRRRSCLRVLEGTNGSVAVDELASAIAADIAEDEEGTLQQSTYISLIQFHLPKLDEYGVIDYDDDAKRVEPGPAFGEAHDCLLTHGEDEQAEDGNRPVLAVTLITAVGLVLALLLPGSQALVLVCLVGLQAVGLAVLTT